MLITNGRLEDRLHKSWSRFICFCTNESVLHVVIHMLLKMSLEEDSMWIMFIELLPAVEWYNIQLTLNVCTKTAKPKLVANAKKMQNYFN